MNDIINHDDIDIYIYIHMISLITHDRYIYIYRYHIDIYIYTHITPMKSPLFLYVNMPLKQHMLKDLRGFSEIHGETRNLKQTEDGVFAHVLTASRSTFKVIQQARQRLGTPWKALERLGDLHMENHG